MDISRNLENSRGTLNAGSGLVLHAGGTLGNAGGKIGVGRDASISAGQMDNTGGVLLADRHVKIDAAGILTNTRGEITSGGDTEIIAGETNLDGILAAGGDLHLTADGSLSNGSSGDGYGVTKAAGHVTIDAAEGLTNAKKIEAGKTLSLSASQLDNTASGELSGADVIIRADILTNEGLISADGASDISAGALYNRENGRIYGEQITIDAGVLENRKNEVLETLLEEEMDALRAIENELEAAFAEDVTAFTSASQKDNYFRRIQSLTEDYAAQLERVNAAQRDMGGHKAGAIAARDTLAITGDTLLNRAGALLYSGGAMTLSEKESLINRSADIRAQGDLAIDAAEIVNSNDEFSARRYWLDENGV